MASSHISATTDIEYPGSDGKPMAETDFQRDPLVYGVEALRAHFQMRDDVYVSGNLFIYYEEGNPRAAVAPDVFVVFGAPKHQRATYRLWQEPKVPDWVMEITSKHTRREDQEDKHRLYLTLGVQEYWQYDPTGDYLDPPLQGFHLVRGQYHALPAATLPDGTRVLASAVLGLDLQLAHGVLHFVNPATGQPLPTYLESRQETAQARQETVQVRQEAERIRQASASRIAELEARLQALQGGRAEDVGRFPSEGVEGEDTFCT